MPKYTVNVPDYASRRKYTPGQFLAEFMVTGRPTYMDLPKPVTAIWAEVGEVAHVEKFTTAAAVFALFQRLHLCRGVLVALYWKGCQIGPVGLYELNRSIREPAIRKGGLNIVRHWLENSLGSMTPTGGTLSYFFDYLEIRPIFRGKRAIAPSSFDAKKTETQAPHAQADIHYV